MFQVLIIGVRIKVKDLTVVNQLMTIYFWTYPTNYLSNSINFFI